MTGKHFYSFVACCCAVGLLLAGLFITEEKANAVDSVSNRVTLTVAQTKALFGDSLTGRYYDGTDYIDFEVPLQGNWDSEKTPYIGDGFFSENKVPWVTYAVNLRNQNSNPLYVSIELNPAVSFTNTFEIHCGVCVLARGNNGASIPPYSTSTWDFYRNGSVTQLDFITSDSGSGSSLSKYTFDGNPYAVCLADMLFQSANTVSFGDINLYGSFNDQFFTVGLACPTISVSGGSSQGIVTSPSGGGGGGSSIDYSPILQEILDKLDAIASQNGYTDSEQDDIEDTDTSITNQTLTVEQIESGEGSLWVSPDSAAIGRWSAGVDAGTFPDLSLSGDYVKQGVTYGNSAFDVRYTALLDDAAERASPAGSFSDFFALLGDFPFFIIGVGLYLFSVILHTG